MRPPMELDRSHQVELPGSIPATQAVLLMTRYRFGPDNEKRQSPVRGSAVYRRIGGLNSIPYFLEALPIVMPLDSTGSC